MIYFFGYDYKNIMCHIKENIKNNINEYFKI